MLSHRVLGGAGLYADVKFSSSFPGNDPYYDSTVTVDQAENQFGDFIRGGRYVLFQMGLEAQAPGAVVGVMLSFPK